MFLGVREPSEAQWGSLPSLHDVWDSGGNGLNGMPGMLMLAGYWEINKIFQAGSPAPSHAASLELSWRWAAGLPGAPGRSCKDSFSPDWEVARYPFCHFPSVKHESQPSQDSKRGEHCNMKHGLGSRRGASLETAGIGQCASTWLQL